MKKFTVLMVALLLVPTVSLAKTASSSEVSLDARISALTAQIKSLRSELSDLKKEQRGSSSKKACKTTIDVKSSSDRLSIKSSHKTDVMGATVLVSLASCEEIEKKSIVMSASLPMTVDGKKHTKDEAVPLVWQDIEKTNGVWKTQVEKRITAWTFAAPGGQPRAGDKKLTFSYGGVSKTISIELRD